MNNISFEIVPADQLETVFGEVVVQQWEEVDERRKTSDLNVQWDTYRQAVTVGSCAWIAAWDKDQDVLLGYISLLLCPSLHTGELTMLTDTIYVLPNGRGQGVGKKLLERAEELGRQIGVKHFMTTFKNSVNHNHLVEALGFFNYETIYCKAL